MVEVAVVLVVEKNLVVDLEKDVEKEAKVLSVVVTVEGLVTLRPNADRSREILVMFETTTSKVPQQQVLLQHRAR